MKKYLLILFSILSITTSSSQINTDRVMMIGRNALYFEDYVLAIQYFNQVIKTKPYLAEPYYYRAVAKYFLDDFKGAEEDCTLSLERNQFLYGAYQLRADAFQNQKKYSEAEKDYEVSIKHNPSDKFLLINLGIVNIENKNFDKAEEYLNKLIGQNPKFTEGYLTRANLYMEEKDTLKALQDIDLAINNDNFFAPSYAMKAGVSLMQKNYEEAIKNYDKSIELDPLSTDNFINRGLAKYYLNDLRGAMSDYDQAIKNDDDNLIAHFNRALLRSQVGDKNRAIQDFNFVLDKEPSNYIAYMNRSLLKSDVGDFKGAISDLNIVLEEYPNFYQGYQLRSDIKQRMNDMKGAERDYNTALRIENKVRQDLLAGRTPKGISDDPDSKTREESDKTINKFDRLVVADKDTQEKNKYKNESRGKVQNKQANVELKPLFFASYYDDPSEIKKFIHYNKEVDDLNKQNLLDQKVVISNHDLQLDSLQIAEHFGSINNYSKKIADQPNNAAFYFARGIDHILIQDFGSAIEDFSKSIQLDPNFTLAYFNLAVAQEKQLQTRLNNPGLYKSNNINPLVVNNGLINTTIGATDKSAEELATKLEYDQILTNYKKVIDLSPNFIYAYYNRAAIKTMQNDLRGAILDYNEAIRREPDFADAYYNRGLNRLRLKDKEKGLDDLRKSGELGIISAYSIIKRMTE